MAFPQKTAAPPEGLDIVNFKSDGTSKGATRSLSISFTDNTPSSLTESSKKVPFGDFRYLVSFVKLATFNLSFGIETESLDLLTAYLPRFMTTLFS